MAEAFVDVLRAIGFGPTASDRSIGISSVAVIALQIISKLPFLALVAHEGKFGNGELRKGSGFGCNQ